MLVNPSAGAEVAYGSYTGDGTSNKAISHGLGKIPKFVFITRDGIDQTQEFHLCLGEDRVHSMRAALGVFTQADALGVTTPTSSVFYIGNAGDAADSANNNGDTYHWVAFG